jgi:hypothetical protein
MSKQNKKEITNSQALTDKEIVGLMKSFSLSYRKMAKIHSRKVSQVYYAVHTRDYPGLRKRMIAGLLKRKAKEA